MNHPTTTPHPYFLDALFAYKSNVNNVFKNVLGLYDISHIAVSYIDENQKLLTFSSGPSLEFNLFTSDLWRFDKTYDSAWYHLGTPSPWQALYTLERYDELYYLKQLKFQYPIGLSFAIKTNDTYMIYSVASHKDDEETRLSFNSQHHHFYKIGEYCRQLLQPLFQECKTISEPNNKI